MYGYGLSNISYANDPYFLYALNSYNPYYAAANAKADLTTTGSAATTADASAKSTVDPTFMGKSSKDSGVGAGTIAAGTLAVAGGAAALIYAAKKGNGEGIIKGFKNIWKSINGKAGSQAGEASSKVSNIIKDGGRNLQEYTIKKDGVQFVMKDGKPVSIITQDKKVITDIGAWLKDPSNKAIAYKIKALDFTKKLPKEVRNVSIAREFKEGKKTYRIIVDKESGNATGAYRINTNGGYEKITDFESFSKKHQDLIKKAETFEHKITGNKVHLYNDNQNYKELDVDEIIISKRHGEVTKAWYKKGNETVEIAEPGTLSRLKKAYEKDIEKIGKKFNYGYESKDCLYEYTSGAKKYRFFGSEKANDRKPFEVVTENELKTTDQINKYLKDRDGIKSELESIASSGSVPESWKVTNMLYKTDSGHTFKIEDGKIVGVKLGEAITLSGNNFESGQLIGSKYFEELKKIEEYNNVFKKVEDRLN